MKDSLPCLYLVVPCYNEEEILTQSMLALSEKLNALINAQLVNESSRIVLVNDGSKDKTWQMIEDETKNNKRIIGIDLFANVGQHFALYSGLMYAKERCDIAITMDVDLQDDIHAIDAMIAEWQKGADVVYGVRNKRDTDTAFKRNTALAYYKVMQWLGVNIVSNHAEYRLMNARILQELARYEEVNLFLRGVVPLIGGKSAIVYYERKARLAGESRYSFKSLLSMAVEAITSLSHRPLRYIGIFGFLVFVFSGLMLAYALISYLVGNAVSGWTSLLASLWMIGGAILLSIGVLGEYVGKIYLEVKRRPRYSVREIIGEDERAEK